MLTAAVFVALALSASPGARASRADEPFAELGFEAALAKANAERKLLFLDFTAEWCQPCKKMEKDTWAAADVRAWLGEHAVALQIDVDAEKELARRFRIEAMPTVIAFRGGEEFDRIIGYKDAEAFLAWGRDVLAGKSSKDELRKRAEELRDSEDVRARYDLARDLARAGMHAEALHHYLWLWPATRRESAFGGVRLSFMLSDMQRLAQAHEPAREAFEGILAELQARIDAAELPTFADWQEWTALCEHFGGNDRVIAWYERHRDEAGRLFPERTGHLPELIVAEVFDVLMDGGRPLDAVRLYEDARARAERIVHHYEQMQAAGPSDPEQRKEMEQFNRAKLVSDMSALYAALLLAERADEAEDVAAELLRVLDTPEARIGLVRAGFERTGTVHASFGKWLDEAEAAGGNVRLTRRRLERAQRDAAGEER